MNLKKMFGRPRHYAIFTPVKEPMKGKSNFDPSDADIEMVVDDARRAGGLPPAKRSAEQGIADMKARIVQINLDKQNTLAALDDPQPGQEKALLDDLQVLKRELAEAEQRLAEYAAQAAGKN